MRSTSTRVFRVVFNGASSLRLMGRPGDPPSTWRLPFASPPVRLVTVRDVIVVDDDLPRHVGLQYVVEIESATIDEAAREAKSWAETSAVLLAVTGRAPVERLSVFVAYDITPRIQERDFRQWVWDPPLPVGKVAANSGVFGEVRERIDALANRKPVPNLLWRTILSMSWFRQALEETDPIFRFHKLWIALEALNPLLDEQYSIPTDGRRGLQGLRRLAEEVGYGSDWVSATLKLRRDLFHGLRLSADNLRTRAKATLGQAEGLAVAGWQLLLGLEQPFADESVVPHPLQLEIRAVLHHSDETTWSASSHPYLDVHLRPEKVETGEPGQVGFSLPMTCTVRNVDALRITAHGMWGPTGYRALNLEDPVDSQPHPGASEDEQN